MNSFSDIISAWPSAAELGRDIGVTGLVVRTWRARGSIPSEYWIAIIRAAKDRKIKGVTLECFARMAAEKGRKTGEGLPDGVG